MKKILKMKFRNVSMIFLMSVLTITLSAQDITYDQDHFTHDKLIIQRVNGQKITAIWDRRKEMNESLGWVELINGFHSNFNKVYENIPEFDFYSILYIQNEKLVVDEVKGKETYTLSGQDEIKYTKSNLCKLVGDEITIFIEFNEKNELLDSTIIKEIRNAVDKIKYKIYFSKMSREQHYFDVKNDEMMEFYSWKTQFGMFFGERVGVVKDKLYMETRVGAGVSVGTIGIGYIGYISGDFIHSYNSENNSTENDVYLGLNFLTSTKGFNFGLEFAYKISEEIEHFEDLDYRLRLMIRPKNGISFGLENYFGDNNNKFYGVSAGFQLDAFF